ncbi:DUF998 domain-containing protein [Kitasatospora sp. NPDC054939]
MTHTATTTVTASTTTAVTPSRQATRTLLAAGGLAGPLFLTVGVAQGLTREGFDFSRNALSQLSQGDLGWIQQASFLLTGGLLIAGAVGVRRALAGGPGGTWAPRLLALFGVSFLVSGVFAADAGAGFPAGTPEGAAGTMSAHGAVHMAAGTVGYLALCALFLVLARHFAASRRRGWAVACRVLPVAVLAGFAGSSATVLAFTLGAGLGLAAISAVTSRLSS